MDKGRISKREGRRDDEEVVVLSQAQRSARPAPVRRRGPASEACGRLLCWHGTAEKRRRRRHFITVLSL